MRTTHKFNLTRLRLAVLLGAMCVLVGLSLGVTPIREAMAARITASPTAAKILSLAPAPIRRAISPQKANTVTKAATANVATAAVFGPSNDIGVALTQNIAQGAAGGNNVYAGEGRVNYTVTVSNGNPPNNPLAVGEVTVSVPALSTILASPVLQVIGFNPPAGFPTCTENTLATGCTNTGAIPAGQSRQFVFQVRLNSAIPSGTNLPLVTANVSANGTTDTTPNNNTSSGAQLVAANEYDLTIDKDTNPAGAVAIYTGGTLTYSIDVTNVGPNSGTGSANADSNAYGFTVTDTQAVPAAQGLSEIVSISSTPANQFNCSPTSGPAGSPTIFTCTYTNAAGLAPGATVRINFTAKVGNQFNFSDAIPDSVTDTATVAAASGPGVVTESPTNNNSDSETTPVLQGADLGISKLSRVLPNAATPQSVLAGGGGNPLANLVDAQNEFTNGPGNITYVLSFGNAGPGDARNVSVEDTIPGNPANIAVASPIVGEGVLNGAAIPVVIVADGAVAVPAGTFGIWCRDFGVGNAFTCRPGNNTATNAAYTEGVMPRNFAMKLAYRTRVLANATPGSIIGNAARIASFPRSIANQPPPAAPEPATPDPNTGNNTSLTTSNVVRAEADLGITKATSNATPVAGGAAFSYTLTVTNNGASDASSVVVTDALPPGALFQNVAIVGAGAFSCVGPTNNTNGTVTCNSALLPASGSATITIVAQYAAALASGVRTNTANVTSGTPEPSPNVSPNSASVQQNIQVDAPLSITKAGPATVCAGDTFTYKITLNNGGSSTALNATITDNLPANTTFVSQVGTNAFAGKCSHNGGTPGTVTCPAVDIPSGQHELNITVKLAANAPTGGLANTATITTAGTGTIAVGNSTTTATVTHCSDLEITKADSPDAVLAGQDINYIITVKNIGPSDLASGEVIVRDTTFPPTGTTLKTGTTLIATGFDCNSTTAFPCTTTAPLPTGASLQIKFTVTVNANFNGGQPGAFVVNTATVNQPQPAGVTNLTEPNTANNTSTVRTPVGPSADLAITKTAQTLLGALFDAQVTAGGTISASNPPSGSGEILYTMNYQNNGLGDASNVHIRDVIPANTLAGLATVTAPGLTCQFLPFLLTTQLDCTPNAGAFGANPAGTLPAGASGSLTMRVRVGANVAEGTAIKNVATINSEQNGASPATPDPNGANNTSNETQNRVRAQVDLAITKTDSPDPVIAGSNVTYTITVTNNGPSDAQNVLVKDTLPPNVSFVSASSTNNQFNCLPDNGNAGIINCTKATLIANDLNIIPIRPTGNVAVITIVGKVNASVTNSTSLTNTATVSTSTNEAAAQLANNTATATTAVTTDAGVSIVKADNPDPVIAGTDLTYNITVTNSGPSDALNAQVVDTLPAGVVFKSVTGTNLFAAANACTQSAGVVTCVPKPAPGYASGTIPAGSVSNITIIVKVNPNVPANADPTTPNNPAGLLNTATVTWQDSNGVIGPLVNNTATDTTRTTVRHESDMSIVKEAPDEVIAGTRMDYKLVITNGGPSDVLGDTTPGSVTIMDTLPAKVVPVDLSGPPNAIGGLVISGPGGFTCSYDGALNKVTCVNAAGAPGNVPAGSVITIVFKVQTDPMLPEGFNLNNCAMVTLRGVPDPTPEIDPNSGNNNSCDSTVVRTLADLGIGKTALPVATVPAPPTLPTVPLPVVGPNVPPGSVNAGGYIKYDVPFGNAGPSDAVNVQITDVVPANTALVKPATSPFTITASDTDGVGTPGPTISLECNVIGQAGSQQIICKPKGNTGLTPSYADGVLPAGYTGILTYYVKVNESVSGGTIVANSANITSAPNGSTPGTADPNPGNNTTLPVTTVVIASSQLSITKTVLSATFATTPPAPAGAVIPGTNLTYRLTVTNNGPSDVSNLRVTDTLPAALDSVGRITGVKYVTAVQSGGFGTTFTCSQPQGVNPDNNPNGNGGTVACTAPLMSANAPNNTATIDITVFIDPATKNNLVNATRVDATVNNFNQPTFSTFTLTTPVGPTSDLVLTKTHTPDPVTAGTDFTYTITLTNNGQSTAQMVSLTDNLPVFQTIKNVAIQQTPDQNGAPNFTCTPAVPIAGTAGGPELTCTAAELPPNKKQDGTVNPSGTVKVILTVRQESLTPQPTPTQYQNCVTATSMSFDPNTANSTNVCDTVNVIFLANLAGTKTDTPDPVIAGNLLTYTITGTNNGPSAALNLKISDPLPTGTVFVSAVASPGATLLTPAVNANGLVTATWDAAGGTPIGLTDVGVTRTLTIVVRVCPDFQQILNLTDAQMCVPNLTNTATITSLTPGQSATATSTTTVQAQSNLAISKSGPTQAQYSTSGSPSNITYTLTFSNAGPSNSSGTMILDVLPKGFTVVGTPTSTVPGTTFEITTVDGVTSVKANLGVLGAANQCQLTRPTSGTIVIIARVPIKHPTITVTNTATISTTNCLPDPVLSNNTATFNTYIVPPGTTPGVPYPALSEVSDQKEGSILFYPIYTSDAVNGNTQNARISLTNTSNTERATIHLFAVDGASCAVLDAFVCLTPNQTTTFLASDFDPGNTGYLVAVAVEDDTGMPRPFNELIGDEYVKFSTGHQANLAAESIAASMMFPAGANPNVTTATLRFDGSNYNRLPRILASDNIPSPADGNSTMMIINRVGGNFTTTGGTIGNITGLLYDDAENQYSFTAALGVCQYRKVLDNTFPRTFTPFNRVLTAGRSGWMKFYTAVNDWALFGAQINFNANASTSANAFNQGHNLHHLTLTDSATIVVPVFIPSC